MAQTVPRAVQLAPLLRPAQWALGVNLGPGVRRLGQALVWASGLMAWLWALADVQALWPLACAVAWSWHLVRLWRRWQRPADPLWLCWRGPPSPGWQVPAWGEASVSVRCVWDGQGALLLHVRTTDGRQQAWAWVRDDGDRDAHRLRTLVHLPEAFLEAMREAGRDTSGDSRRQAPMA